MSELPRETSAWDPRRILLFGATGLLGSALDAALRERGIDAARPAHGDCDIADENAVRRQLAEAAPELVINCAAFNAVDAAETEAGPVFRSNARGPANLARLSPALVHFSTDFVFGGPRTWPWTEEDTPQPLSVYGRAKLQGDEAVRALNPRHFLVRVGCLYGPGTRGFASSLLHRLRRGERIRADAERRIQPTWVRPLAEQILLLISSGGFGLFHATSHGETTWADFALELARLAGLAPGLIEPVSTAALQAPAARPGYAVLQNLALSSRGIDCMPHWRDGLQAYLAEEAARASGAGRR